MQEPVLVQTFIPEGVDLDCQTLLGEVIDDIRTPQPTTLDDLQWRFGASPSQGCRVAMISRSLNHYRSRTMDQTLLILRANEIAATRARDGHQRIYVLLRREGWTINLTRVYRLYRQEGLCLISGVQNAAVRRNSAPQMSVQRRSTNAGTWISSGTSCTMAASYER